MKVVVVLLVFSVFALSGCSPSSRTGSGVMRAVPAANPSAPEPAPAPASPSADPAQSKDATTTEQATAKPFDWTSRLPPVESDSEGELEISSQAYFDQQIVECDGPCKSGVGLLLASNLSREVHACTAFLVNPDTILTDSHCLPDDLKAVGSGSLGRMQVKFPKNDESDDVAEVIFASDISDRKNFSPDYAVLKLATRSHNEPLALSRAGFSDKTYFKIWRVTPGGGIHTLSATNCMATQNTNLFPEFRNDQSPMAALSNCSIVPGNSGGPLLNDKDEVVGLLKAYFRIEDTPVGGIMNPGEARNFPRVALVTSLACLKDFSSEPSVLPEACNEDLSGKAYYKQFSLKYQEILGQEGSDIDAQVQSHMQYWQTQNSKIFRWKFRTLNQKADPKEVSAHPSYSPEVDCVEPTAQWIDGYKSFGGYFYKSSAEVTGGLYSFGPGVGADSHLNLFPLARTWQLGTYKIKFNPSEILKKGVAHLTVTETMNLFGHDFSLPIPKTVSICK